MAGGRSGHIQSRSDVPAEVPVVANTDNVNDSLGGYNIPASYSGCGVKAQKQR